MLQVAFRSGLGGVRWFEGWPIRRRDTRGDGKACLAHFTDLFCSLEVLGMYVDIFLSFTSVVQRGVWQQCVWQQCVACCTWACTVVALVPSSSSTQAPALNEAGGMVYGDRHGLYSVLMMC